MKQELCSKQVRLLTHEFKINKQAVRDDNYEVKTNTKEIAEVFKKNIVPNYTVQKQNL